MKLYHTSPDEIKKIEKYGFFDDMLFFAVDPYEMSVGKTLLYSIDIEEDKILTISQLFYDHFSEEIQEIIDHVMRMLGCDEETAMDLLDDSVSGIDTDMDSADASWFIQTQQGHIARELGYLAASGRDEQGQVYIVPMCGKETLLTKEDW